MQFLQGNFHLANLQTDTLEWTGTDLVYVELNKVRVQQSKHLWPHQRIGGATSTSLQPAMRLAWLNWRGNGDQAGEEGAMLIENVRHRSRGGRCQVNRCHGGLWTPGDGQDMRWGSGRCRKGRAQSINQEEHICSMIFLRQRNNWVLDLNFKKKLLF